jgi:hypothetical protein
MRFFTAVKLWNNQTKQSAWCVPKKGTPEYDIVMKIMKGEVKTENIIEPPKPKDSETKTDNIQETYKLLQFKYDKLDDAIFSANSAMSDFDKVLVLIDKDELDADKDKKGIDLLKENNIKVVKIPRKKNQFKVDNKEENRKKINDQKTTLGKLLNNLLKEFGETGKKMKEISKMFK